MELKWKTITLNNKGNCKNICKEIFDELIKEKFDEIKELADEINHNDLIYIFLNVIRLEKDLMISLMV